MACGGLGWKMPEADRGMADAGHGMRTCVAGVRDIGWDAQRQAANVDAGARVSMMGWRS
ncbi:hypothetical protein GCM10010411_88410 [Actinomadura fulvescens]|uniref:Uncharacterized protein n=1 Tax=Actinomadura fulvescens TaxID=46160 RepID=A0ABP6D9G9_9ACTN